MTMRITGLLIGAALFLCAAAPALAGWNRHDPRPGMIQPRANPGRYTQTAWWAVPSESRKFSGGYVGGGAVLFGEPRRSDEGTWGWDYDGAVLQKRIWLNWWHGRRHQDGGGSYEPDGPKFFGR